MRINSEESAKRVTCANAVTCVVPMTARVAINGE
jgi:hypothetical protein